MGSVGDAYDNALCESFFATLECELIERRRFANRVEAKMAVFRFIEGWYNRVADTQRWATSRPSISKRSTRRPREHLGLQSAEALPTLADSSCLPLPCASGAAEASDSIGGGVQKQNSNTYLSTESGEVHRGTRAAVKPDGRPKEKNAQEATT